MSIDYNKMMNSKVMMINQMIDEFLPEYDTIINDEHTNLLFEAVNYSIKAGGKRIRSLFMLECFLIFSETDELKDAAYKLLPNFIAAIEMIHTYSLVHDDLPAMDDDMYRRGKLTTHAKFGEALGILAGDGLLNLAFETVAKASQNIDSNELYSNELYKRLLKAIDILSKKSGIYGMVGGQVIDILKNGKFSSADELRKMYKMKTAALLEASMTIGAVLSGADEKVIETLSQAAKDIGIAFQIQDDILDVTGDESVIGKPINSDEKNKKTTFITLYSLEGAVRESEILSKHASDEINKLTKDIINKDEGIFLQDLISSLVHRKK